LNLNLALTIHHKMRQRISTLFTCLLVVLVGSLFGQTESWSLEKCIQYAKQHNLQVKATNYNLQTALLTEKETAFQRLPSLNAGVVNGFQYGRTIDPTTNSYNNNKIGYSSYSLNASLPIYNGQRTHNSLAKAKLETKIAKLDQDIINNDITLAITQAYLAILLSEEQVANAKKRIEKSTEQQTLVEHQIQLGALRKNAKLEFTALVYKDEQVLIEAENQRLINYLELKQLLELEAEVDFQIEQPKYEQADFAEEQVISLTSLLEQALPIQPQIRADELRLKSVEKDIAIAKAGYYPTISIFGTLSTNTSSKGKKVEGLETVQVRQNGMINGTPADLELEQIVPNLIDASYGEQLNENFGQGLGIDISIPIYNKHRNKIAVEKAKVNLLRTRTTFQQNKQQLKMKIIKAYTDVQAAKKNYKAAQKSLTAVQLAYKDILNRFELGMANTYELTATYNDLEIAQFDSSKAKFQLLFYRKVVEFYKGIPITMRNE